MKNACTPIIALLLSLSVIFSNCTPDYTFIQSTEETLTRNGWSVDYYFQQQDMTNQFGNYRITFTTNGTINCQNGNDVVTGDWNRVVSSDQIEIIGININCSDPDLNRLSGSWSLKNQTASTLSFEDNHVTTSVLRIKIQP
jgi:hypothetical protein